MMRSTQITSFAPAGYPVIRAPMGWGFDTRRRLPRGFQAGVTFPTRERAIAYAWSHHEYAATIERYQEACQAIPFLDDLDAGDAREIMARYFAGENVFYLNCIAYTRAGHADA